MAKVANREVRFALTFSGKNLFVIQMVGQ